MRTIWMRGIAAAGLAWVALVGDARAQARPEAAESQDRPGGQGLRRARPADLPGPDRRPAGRAGHGPDGVPDGGHEQ